MMELINGYWGQDHVTSYQEAAIQAGILGANNCVLGYVGQAMMAEAVTANKVRIHDGVHVAYGKAIIINKDEYEDVEIENGTAGMLRNDMIIIRYTKDETTGVEKVAFDVLQGQSGAKAVDPTPNTQDMYDEGVLESEIPFVRVSLNGLAITSVTPLYTTVPSIAQLNGNLLYNGCIRYSSNTTNLLDDVSKYSRVKIYYYAQSNGSANPVRDLNSRECIVYSDGKVTAMLVGVQSNFESMLGITISGANLATNYAHRRKLTELTLDTTTYSTQLCITKIVGFK